MNFLDAYLAEFDHEMKTTRSLLEIVPPDSTDWKPHPKASSLGFLATHLANLPSWLAMIFAAPDFDANPGGKPARVPYESVERALQMFDENVAKAREALTSATPDVLGEPWSLKSNGATVFTMPRAVVLRTFVMNHLIHHRGQLSVYLRALDVKLPSIYGPTADTP
ncbi:MAG TPA: DinB family protein [Thermoanaerobaculia bacterium]